jgi:hypothetical protein
MILRTTFVTGMIVLLTGFAAGTERQADGMIPLERIGNPSPTLAETPPGGLGANGPVIKPLGDPCQPTPQILTFTATPSNVDLGANTKFSWNVQVPSGCEYSLVVREWPLNWAEPTRVFSVQPDQTLQVDPISDAHYDLILKFGNLSVWPTSTVLSTPQLVTVNLPFDRTPIPRCTKSGGCVDVIPDCLSPAACRHAVTINSNNLGPLLVQALKTPNTTVVVRNRVELDLTPHRRDDLPTPQGGAIHIAEGVELIGERIAEPGKRFQPGPRLYVTSAWLGSGKDPDRGTFLLFWIDGYHVRISGVRIEGPGAPEYTIGIHFSEERCKDKPSTDENACSSARSTPTPARINIEIDHNEFSGWATVAVEVAGPFDIGFGENIAGQVWQSWLIRTRSDSSGIHYPLEPEPIRIHDNHFHHNWYGQPYLGYSVLVGLGTHALIERNVFQEYYHAITTNGNFGTGYRAYRNLVLQPADTEQQFDMHGRRCPEPKRDHRLDPCPDTPSAFDIDIQFNSFLYRSGPAIELMGYPELLPFGFAIKSNVFAHDLIGGGDYSCNRGNEYTPDLGALVLCSFDRGVLRDGNLLGVTSWDDDAHHDDTCDFDGDGIPDRFLTTGQTWWYRSGNLTNGWPPWVFLNTSTLLASDLRVAASEGGCDLNLSLIQSH